ncbi:MAG TPA: nitrogenase cofactor biosynthesis protein NifB [Methylomusa anaerophila]|uniref:FeMo cofactor biosynthesis protein NifB n=1 Tax=Methylomusa anaerophila TaxID=1930071 RepID=A0A348AFG2_9FIRM|nr:nitrogenase cofactor biosynthesis protein NifB [Methylomusa anaerophila]BBB89810.1 FeMo cofactor biosynthesis protein NifB [Methylomusa anaerophila]HML89144.1 nitrogenase cofactor biosynthesis protein NifB [Methylomusa anaerophila]
MPLKTPEEVAAATAKHPCYSCDAQHKFARMHIPVAPECNISCNYCNRRFDCVNESRPGVTSEILTPAQACDKFLRVKSKLPNLSVVGIAGPGDALANWEQTRESVELIKRRSPEILFCLSTNGLMLPQYAPEIVALGLNHVTVTVNCLNPSIGASIYRHVWYQGRHYIREQAAEILIHNQMAGIEYLAGRGVLVKVNIVMINGINNNHIVEVVKKVKQLGAVMTNIMPLIPAPGSVFENLPQTSMKDLTILRDICQEDIAQMRHCRQCRADAVGLLGNDQAHNFRAGGEQAAPDAAHSAKVYRIAVTSKYRKLVDLHYGHAEEFHIYESDGINNLLLETRKTVKYCQASDDNEVACESQNKTVQAIADCDAVLTMRIGYDAQKHLARNGIKVVEACGSVEEGLQQACRYLDLHQAGPKDAAAV